MDSTLDSGAGAIRHVLAGDRGAVGTRLAASLAAACLCTALALCGSAVIAHLRPPVPIAVATSMPATTLTIPIPATQPGLPFSYSFNNQPSSVLVTPNSATPTTSPSTQSASAPAVITISGRGSAAFAVRTSWHIRDQDILHAFVLAAAVWLILLGIIWRPLLRRSAVGRATLFTLWMGWVVLIGAAAAETSSIRRAIDDEWLIGGSIALASVGAIVVWISTYQSYASMRMGAIAPSFSRPVAGSMAVVIATVVIAELVDRALRFQEEIFVAATVCIGAAALIRLWIPIIARLENCAVRSDDGQVQVNCPKCGYSLVGLTELRCPECGERFTLDEIIAAQGYAESRSEQPDRGPSRNCEPNRS